MDAQNNINKMLNQLSNSMTNFASKKLSFDDKKNLNEDSSCELTMSKKRKLSEDKIDLQSTIVANENLNNSISNESLNTSIGLPSSPWETRRMKADLLEAKSRIIKLKSEIEQQHKLRINMENLYSAQVTELKKQCEFSSDKVLDMEKHLKLLRKREATAKQDLIKIKGELDQMKQSYEDKVYTLQRTNCEMEENTRHLQHRLTNEINEYKRVTEKLQIELNIVNEELENIRNHQDEMQEKAFAFDELHSELEEERQEHELTKSKIKELEYQISSYGDYKELSKTMENRLANIPDLEKEIIRLQKENKNLQENIGEKLLLEEQVHDLKSRLERSDNASSDAAALRTQISCLERELNDWKNVGKDHCLPHQPVNPSTLRSRIEQILQKDLILASEKGNSKSEKESYQLQVQELKAQNEILSKNNNSLKAALKQREAIMMRAKKKLLMVGKERDCYKQLVENFEKDMTISGALIDTMNPDLQIRTRCDILEKSLVSYKELCTNLQKELESVKQYADLGITESPIISESYEHLKKEITDLRFENDRLKRRKEELELEMEHRCLKGDFNIDKYKVVHMTMNPAAEAYENTKNEIEKLQAEIERLKRRNRKLEEEQEEMTQRLNDTNNLTVNIKELNHLRSKLESAESKMQHMKEVYKSANLEFREVCYMLFGYRIDRVGNSNYRISSMYADSEDEYLNFRLNESGILDMLETDYSISLNEMVSTHLAAHNSLPAFLSALTLELFNRTTIMV
ncbi:mitotic spindle assembly checkpoint protein MAD1 [Condylostylus longicornis]|uniref:mitotic spindle assembly checkpoint protein MAD1 n=1 Tax=Condylostylus longicornis TaxID=2530218 RepID=UPI00244E56C3|nr:mitotic spindle assembly checkpoint protein MAD1 [Condylostylus longicornis]